MSPSDDPKNKVNALGKGLRVLEAFTARHPELLLSEIARRADLDNATTFRMLNTLVEFGYVQKVSDTKRFRLTFKCLDLGFNAIARTDLRTLAQPILRSFLGDVAEAASLGVLDRGEVIFIERIQAGLNRTAVDIRIGMRLNAYSSALGQAVLAFLPPEQQEAHLEAIPRVKLTPFTLTSLKDLRARLKEVRAQGFALADQESVIGLRVLAAPVLAADGSPIAALSVASANFTVSLESFSRQYAKRVKEAAGSLTKALRASGSVLTEGSSRG